MRKLKLDSPTTSPSEELSTPVLEKAAPILQKVETVEMGVQTELPEDDESSSAAALDAESYVVVPPPPMVNIDLLVHLRALLADESVSVQDALDLLDDTLAHHLTLPSSDVDPDEDESRAAEWALGEQDAASSVSTSSSASTRSDEDDDESEEEEPMEELEEETGVLGKATIRSVKRRSLSATIVEADESEPSPTEIRNVDLTGLLQV